MKKSKKSHFSTKCVLFLSHFFLIYWCVSSLTLDYFSAFDRIKFRITKRGFFLSSTMNYLLNKWHYFFQIINPDNDGLKNWLNESYANSEKKVINELMFFVLYEFQIDTCIVWSFSCPARHSGNNPTENHQPFEIIQKFFDRYDQLNIRTWNFENSKHS